MNLKQRTIDKQRHQVLVEPRITTQTRRILRFAGYHPQRKTKNKYRHLKYRNKTAIKKMRTQSIHVSLDYACMQYFGIVRHYIQKRYNIDLKILEYILFVFPLGIISKKDHRMFPNTYSTRSIRKNIKMGLLEPMFEDYGPTSEKQTYRLTAKYKRICMEFYEHLHLEKEIPEVTRYNKLLVATAGNVDQKQGRATLRFNKVVRGEDPFDGNDSEAMVKMKQRLYDAQVNRDPEHKKELKNQMDKVLRQQKLDEIIERKKTEQRKPKS